jgi:hypothetical protein
LIKALPKGMKFNSNFDIHEIWAPLLDWCKAQFGVAQRNLAIHADNARPHTAKVVADFCEENEITVAPHPRYSPDLAPSDFYLFGFLKDRLKGSVYDEPGELIVPSRHFWKTLSPPRWKAFFVIGWRNFKTAFLAMVNIHPNL